MNLTNIMEVMQNQRYKLHDLRVELFPNFVLVDCSASGEVIGLPYGWFQTRRGGEIAYEHVSQVFSRYNLDLKGTIDFDEFYYFVRSTISEKRKEMIKFF